MADTLLELPPIRTTDMPPDVLGLLRDHPRESWEAHPGFREKTKGWLRAHQGFRQLSELVRKRTEELIDGQIDDERYGAQLSYYGSILVGNLHGHHGWEDREYFPELAAAEPRLQAGLDILEADHLALNQVLDAFTRSANRVLSLIKLDKTQVRDEAGPVLDHAIAIEGLLKRHLGDEEDLAVPIILKHRLRG